MTLRVCARLRTWVVVCYVMGVCVAHDSECVRGDVCGAEPVCLHVCLGVGACSSFKKSRSCPLGV